MWRGLREKKHWDRNTITFVSSVSQLKITQYTCTHILEQFSDLPPQTCYLHYRSNSTDKRVFQGQSNWPTGRATAPGCTLHSSITKKFSKTTFDHNSRVDAEPEKCVIQRNCYIFLYPHHKLASVWHQCKSRILNSWRFIQSEIRVFKLSAHKMITKPISQNIWRNVLEPQR